MTGGGFDPTLDHATYAPGNHWTTGAGTNPVGQYIDWTFAMPQTLGAAYIWNHRSNGVADNPGYEPTLFNLKFFDVSGGLLNSLTGMSLLPDIATAQRIDFTLINNVSRVRFDVLQTQSSRTYTGLAEVAFDTHSFGAVPEPATWAMMTLGFGAVGFAVRRKKASARIRFA